MISSRHSTSRLPNDLSLWCNQSMNYRASKLPKTNYQDCCTNKNVWHQQNQFDIHYRDQNYIVGMVKQAWINEITDNNCWIAPTTIQELLRNRMDQLTANWLLSINILVLSIIIYYSFVISWIICWIAPTTIQELLRNQMVQLTTRIWLLHILVLSYI